MIVPRLMHEPNYCQTTVGQQRNILSPRQRHRSRTCLLGFQRLAPPSGRLQRGVARRPLMRLAGAPAWLRRRRPSRRLASGREWASYVVAVAPPRGGA